MYYDWKWSIWSGFGWVCICMEYLKYNDEVVWYSKVGIGMAESMWVNYSVDWYLKILCKVSKQCGNLND